MLPCIIHSSAHVAFADNPAVHRHQLAVTKIDWCIGLYTTRTLSRRWKDCTDYRLSSLSSVLSEIGWRKMDDRKRLHHSRWMISRPCSDSSSCRPYVCCWCLLQHTIEMSTIITHNMIRCCITVHSYHELLETSVYVIESSAATAIISRSQLINSLRVRLVRFF